MNSAPPAPAILYSSQSSKGYEFNSGISFNQLNKNNNNRHNKNNKKKCIEIEP